MSKKRVLAVAFISILLVSMLVGMQLVQLAKAAPDAPTITLQSPKAGIHTSIYVPLIIIAESSTTPKENVFFKEVVYYVDGIKKGEQHSFMPVPSGYAAQLILSKGTHTIQVTASAQTYTFDLHTVSYSPIAYFDSGKILITIDPLPTPIPSEEPASATQYFPRIANKEAPTLTIFSPLNETVYNLTNISIDFNVTKPDSWYTENGDVRIGVIDRIEYVLDPAENGSTKKEINTPANYHTLANRPPKEIPFSVLLTNLTEGTHRISIEAFGGTYYAPFGDQVYFCERLNSTIANIIFAIESKPTTTQMLTGFLGTSLPIEYGYAIIAVLVIVAVAGLGLVYFKKLRHKADG